MRRFYQFLLRLSDQIVSNGLRAPLLDVLITFQLGFGYAQRQPIF
jgi:hypothetical protein